MFACVTELQLIWKGLRDTDVLMGLFIICVQHNDAATVSQFREQLDLFLWLEYEHSIYLQTAGTAYVSYCLAFGLNLHFLANIMHYYHIKLIVSWPKLSPHFHSLFLFPFRFFKTYVITTMESWLCCQEIIEVCNIMTSLSLSVTSQKLLLGTVSWTLKFR